MWILMRSLCDVNENDEGRKDGLLVEGRVEVVQPMSDRCKRASQVVHPGSLF